MTEQEIYLGRYGWAVHVMSDVRPEDAAMVEKRLRDLECGGVPLEDAYSLVLEGKPNKGLTYSNVDTGKSVVVIGWAVCDAEYMNSLCHEMLHVVQHISEVFMVDIMGRRLAICLVDWCKLATKL